MRSILLTAAAGMVCAVCGAQSLSPEVVSSGGHYFDGGTAQLSWTIGEPVSETVTDGTNTLTQGFHQHDLLVTALNPSDNELKVSVFPIPTASTLNVELNDPLADQQMTVELFDIQGTLISKTSASGSVQLNMQNQATGTYILRVIGTEGKANRFEIIKNN